MNGFDIQTVEFYREVLDEEGIYLRTDLIRATVWHRPEAPQTFHYEGHPSEIFVEDAFICDDGGKPIQSIILPTRTGHIENLAIEEFEATN